MNRGRGATKASNNTSKSVRQKATKIAKRQTKTKSKSKPRGKTRGSRRKNLADDGYVRPKATSSEMLTADEIKVRLRNYDRVMEEDLLNLEMDEKIRYFEVLDDGKFKYKPGGFLLVNGAPDYLVLTTSKGSWSVQLENHVIFKSKDIDVIEETHRLEIDKLKQNEERLYKLLIKQKNMIARLRHRIDELEN
jgi:hypothetical protein